jgi:hypothetical protein
MDHKCHLDYILLLLLLPLLLLILTIIIIIIIIINCKEDFSEANSASAGQEIPRPFMETEDAPPCPKSPPLALILSSMDPVHTLTLSSV